ncbi:MAG: hypothetical protein DHS20C03_37100 [Minwuia thermotolerans]|nr:MAG: hypothetical protein DHS20C03_37100 [Minwuia thermotolerans]
MTPRIGSSGVVAALNMRRVPSSSSTSRSVKVPPVSTANRIVPALPRSIVPGNVPKLPDQTGASDGHADKVAREAVRADTAKGALPAQVSGPRPCHTVAREMHRVAMGGIAG